MDLDKADGLSDKLNDSNYSLWAFQFSVFVEGKGLLDILDGTSSKPAEDAKADVISLWKSNNAKLKSWILRSVDPAVALSLRSFSTAHEMWEHLEASHSQVDASRQFDIEYQLSQLSQGDKSIRDYYRTATNLWIEHDLITASLLTKPLPAEVIKAQKQSRMMQFLTKLRPEYEPVRAAILNRKITSLEAALAELSREEKRLTTQAQVDITLHENNSVFAVSGPGNNNGGYMGGARSSNALHSRPQFSSSTSDSICCHFCQELGHIQPHCRKRNLCSYCKRSGHIILDCPKLKNRPQRPTHTPQTSSATFAVQASTPVTSSSITLTAEQLDAFFQQALHKALPTVMNGAFFTTSDSGKSQWLLDSAAFKHMTSQRSIFHQFRPVSDMSLQVANGSRIPFQGIGDIGVSDINLSATLHVPKLVPILVSVGQLAEQGCRVIFDQHGCVVQDRNTGRMVGSGSKHGRLYQLDRYQSERNLLDGSADQKLGFVFSVARSNTIWDLWHSRLGHPHSLRLQSMFKNKLLPDSLDLSVISNSKCMSCVAAKMAQLPFSNSTREITEPFHVIHTDLWGPSPVTSRLGYRYFALFIDHATRYTWIYFLRMKSELEAVATEFVNMIQTQFSKSVKIIRSDTEGEFNSASLHAFYKSHGILSQQSCPGVPQQNGLVERKHRHVLKLARAILLHSGVPSQFWVEAVHIVVHLINRQLTPTLQNRSPFNALYDSQPNYANLRVFGCVCFVMLAPKE
ncbi:Retrovirus-related Pol polyprotein from transposon RE1 [Linum grandiflorum]